MLLSIRINSLDCQDTYVSVGWVIDRYIVLSQITEFSCATYYFSVAIKNRERILVAMNQKRSIWQGRVRPRRGGDMGRLVHSHGLKEEEGRERRRGGPSSEFTNSIGPASFPPSSPPSPPFLPSSSSFSRLSLLLMRLLLLLVLPQLPLLHSLLTAALAVDSTRGLRFLTLFPSLLPSLPPSS